MRLVITLFLVLVIINPAHAKAQNAFSTLSQTPASRLDIALSKLRLHLLNWEFGNKNKKYRSFKINDALVLFNKGKLKITADVNTEPDRLSCETALGDLMQYFDYAKNSDTLAAAFYSDYFMPATAPPLTYEVNLYKSVHKNTSFEITISQKAGTPEYKCYYSGSEENIKYKKFKLR